MKVTATVRFVVRKADLRTTIQFCKKPDTFEILEADGERFGWAENEEDACAQIEVLFNRLGLVSALEIS